jgi:4-diphosphocytidyl-2-C-methyl-D-erythritol kinase
VVEFVALSKRAGSRRRLVVLTPAKVNLALDVLGKRSDGYHEIATVMQTVDLFDRLTLEAAPTISLEADDPALPTDERNLIVRAAMLLRKASGADRGARIQLRKRIPVAAGLGGGSSDAAATLWGLNRLWGLRWSRARLVELAAQLGMDVPFFLTGGAALATGRGERVKPLTRAGSYALVLVNPCVPLSTREVYERVPAGWRAEPSGAQRVVEALATGNAARVGAALTNQLEAFVARVFPPVDRMKAALMAAGALGSAMSGSGPTVFGMARSLDHARQIRQRVCRRGWSCWAVRTRSGPAMRLAQAP